MPGPFLRPPQPVTSTWWYRRTPASGAVVLATVILSVGLHLAGHETLSRIALALATLAWVVVGAAFAMRLLKDRASWLVEAQTPGALTAIGGTALLGTRVSLLGHQPLAEALLALAAVLWPTLFVLVVTHWKRRMAGSVFLGCLATEALAVTGATLADALDTAWLAHTALVFFWLGLGVYCLAVFRFDVRQLLAGAGDHWLGCGAVAASALAGSHLVAADDGSVHLWNADDDGVLRAATGVLLTLAVAWYAVLLVAECARPRLRYDVRRWATVFPLGLTATACLSVASVLDADWLRVPGRVLLWVAVAVWFAVAAGAALTARARAEAYAARLAARKPGRGR